MDRGERLTFWFLRVWLAIQIGGVLWWLWHHFRPGLVLLAALVLWVLYLWRREQLRRTRQGWWVTVGGGAEDLGVYYHEGKERKLSLSGEAARRPNWVDILSEEKWQRKMPDWAQGRRREILQRIRQDASHVRFQEDGVDVTEQY